MKHILTITILLAACACAPKWEVLDADGYTLTVQKGGPALGYTTSPILHDKGYAFKDLNRDGVLDPYEDWRLPALERAMDLASQLSVEEIAGLMLYSSHQAIPGSAYGFGAATYSNAEHKSWDLTDQQIRFLKEDHLRAVLVTTVESPEVAARWNNNVQAYADACRYEDGGRSVRGRSTRHASPERLRRQYLGLWIRPFLVRGHLRCQNRALLPIIY